MRPLIHRVMAPVGHRTSGRAGEMILAPGRRGEPKKRGNFNAGLNALVHREPKPGKTPVRAVPEGAVVYPGGFRTHEQRPVAAPKIVQGGRVMRAVRMPGGVHYVPEGRPIGKDMPGPAYHPSRAAVAPYLKRGGARERPVIIREPAPISPELQRRMGYMEREMAAQNFALRELLARSKPRALDKSTSKKLADFERSIESTIFGPQTGELI